jgi:hypothetical protein
VFKADNDMRAIGRRRGGWRAVAAAALAVCAPFALPVAAQAEPILKGKTNLRLSRVLMAELRAAGVSVTKLQRAKVKGRVVSLPVSGGEVDLTNGSGNLEHEGGFALATAKGAVKVTALQLDTARRALWGEVDGRRMKVAGFARYTAERDGFGDDVAVPALKLQPGVASRLDRGLGLAGVFAGRRVVASLDTGFRPQFDTVASPSPSRSWLRPALRRVRSKRSCSAANRPATPPR